MGLGQAGSLGCELFPLEPGWWLNPLLPSAGLYLSLYQPHPPSGRHLISTRSLNVNRYAVCHIQAVEWNEDSAPALHSFFCPLPCTIFLQHGITFWGRFGRFCLLTQTRGPFPVLPPLGALKETHILNLQGSSQSGCLTLCAYPWLDPCSISPEQLLSP